MLVAEGGHFQKSARYFQWMLGLCIVLILIGIFMNRILQVSVDVERAAFARVLSMLRSELNLYSLAYVMRRDSAALSVYENTNPMKIVKNIPENYMGEHVPAAGKMLPDGSWYYDLESKELVYKIRQVEHFISDQSVNGEARYQIKFFLQNNATHGKSKQRPDYMPGLRLESQGHYQWQ